MLKNILNPYIFVPLKNLKVKFFNSRFHTPATIIYFYIFIVNFTFFYTNY